MGTPERHGNKVASRLIVLVFVTYVTLFLPLPALVLVQGISQARARIAQSTMSLASTVDRRNLIGQ
jgi:uncharacterized membrane protein YesL